MVYLLMRARCGCVPSEEMWFHVRQHMVAVYTKLVGSKQKAEIAKFVNNA